MMFAATCPIIVNGFHTIFSYYGTYHRLRDGRVRYGKPRDVFANIWKGTKEYFQKVDPAKIPQAEKNPKMKMALVFRWYLGSSSRWAVQGDLSRKFDMQIWCGQAMGAFNLWVKGTALEKAENRRVGEIANLLLNSCAYHYMKNLLIRVGADSEDFAQDIL